MTTEAGRALLRSDFDTTGWGPRMVREHVTKAVAAIEREAWLQGHDEAVRLQAEYDRDAVAAERRRIKVAVEGRMVTRNKPAEHEWSRGFRDGWNDAIGTALRIIEGDTP